MSDKKQYGAVAELEEPVDWAKAERETVLAWWDRRAKLLYDDIELDTPQIIRKPRSPMFPDDPATIGWKAYGTPVLRMRDLDH